MHPWRQAAASTLDWLAATAAACDHAWCCRLLWARLPLPPRALAVPRRSRPTPRRVDASEPSSTTRCRGGRHCVDWAPALTLIALGGASTSHQRERCRAPRWVWVIVIKYLNSIWFHCIDNALMHLLPQQLCRSHLGDGDTAPDASAAFRRLSPPLSLNISATAASLNYCLGALDCPSTVQHRGMTGIGWKRSALAYCARPLRLASAARFGGSTTKSNGPGDAKLGTHLQYSLS